MSDPISPALQPAGAAPPQAIAGPLAALRYTIAQFAGAIAAVQVMALLIGVPYRHAKVNFVVPAPGPMGAGVAWVAEFLMTGVLMFVVLMIANRKALEKWAPLIVGVILAVYLAVETPLSGMSLNPARTFGSTFAAGEWEHYWIYLTAPTAGALLATELYRIFQKRHLGGASVPAPADGGK